MKFKWLSAILILLFFASMSVLVIMLKKPICIDSKVIDKIDKVTEHGTVSAWNCEAHRWIPYDEKMENKLPRIARRLEMFETFFESHSSLIKKANIVWLDAKKNTLRIQDQTVFISEDYLFTRTILQESLIRLWLREQSKSDIFARTLMEGVLVDVLQFLMGHQQDSAGKLSSNPEKPEWPRTLNSANESCRTGIASQEYFFNCEGDNAHSDAVILGSVRHLVSSALIDSIKDLSLSETTQILPLISEFLQFAGSRKRSAIFLEEGTLVNNIETAHSQIALIIDELKKFQPADESRHQVWTRWNEEFADHLKAIGYLDKNTLPRLDHLIFVSTSVIQTMPEMIKSLSILNPSAQSVGILDDSHIWFVPAQLPLNRNVFSSVQSFQLTYIGCEFPNQSELESISSMGEKLMVVRYCGDLSHLIFRKYFLNGFAGFAIDNPQVSFVQLHLPSMKLKMPKDWSKIWAVLEAKNWHSPMLKKLGWQTPEWDESIKAFRSKSVVDAIQAFRF